MRIIQTIAQAETALAAFAPEVPAKSQYTLGAMTNLMEFLGNPQNSLRIVHIAGTSGKTSTTYFVASLLETAGFTVGFSVSPHIDSIMERAQVRGVPFTEEDYCRELSIFLDMVDESGINVSYFEVLVAFAYWLFAKLKLDYVVMEVGLGGLLDATNVVTRQDKICVITDIGFDHTNILGNTLAEITQQKAGIITQGNDVFVHDQPKEVIDGIESKGRTEKASVHIVKAPTTGEETPDVALFRQRNWHLAREVVDSILKREKRGIKFTANDLEHAADVYIPARMESIAYKDTTIVLDGSHNPQKLTALVESMKYVYKDKTIALLVSFGENKQETVEESLKVLRKLSDTIILTSFSTGFGALRPAISPKILQGYAKTARFKNIQIIDDPSEAFSKLCTLSTDIKLVTGSFYLLNHIRPLIFNTPQKNS
jgi:dihydrofolate synthase/folylpolyglutamate synthase